MAPRKVDSGQFTPAELELMQILWEHGPATVQMVLDHLPAGRSLAYTTVQTVLGVLHRKSKVKRLYKNRAYYYEAAVSREKAAKSAIGDLVKRLFGGEPEQLVLAMVETQQLTPEKIEELQRLLDEALERRRKGAGQ